MGSSLRARLLLLVGLSLLPSLALSLYTVPEHRARAQEDATRETLRITRLACLEQDRLIESARQMLTAISNLSAVRRGDTLACNALFSDFLRLNPCFANFGLTDAAGMIYSSGLPIEGPVAARDRSWFRRAMAERAFAIGDYQIGRITKKSTVNLGLPILEGERVRGVLFAALDLSCLQELAAHAELPPDSVMIVMDANGTILVHAPDPDGWVGRQVADHPLAADILKRGEGIARTPGLDGVERVHAFAPLRHRAQAGNAFLAIGVPVGAYEAATTRLLYRSLAWIALGGALAVAAAWFLGYLFVVRRTQALVHAAQRLMAGDLRARAAPRNPAGELGQLERAFDNMAATIEKRDAKLREAEANYRALVEEIPAIIYVQEARAGGSLVYMSPQAERYLGFGLDDWKTQPDLRLKQMHADDRERYQAEFHRTLTEGIPLAVEYRLQARDGRIRWYRDTAVIIRNAAGAPQFVRGFLVDITERKTLEEQFLQAQKMEAIGRLAGSVAHDFNNLLTVMTGYCQLLLADIPQDDPRHPHIEEIHNAGRRATTLTRQLLAFSRKHEAHLSALDLNSVVSQMEKMLRRLVGEPVAIETRLDPSLGPVRADVGHLEQVIMNLVVNARDAMPNGGTITIATKNLAIDTTLARHLGGIRPGDYSTLSVADTGIGMDARTLSRVFEPFFTTKEKGKGTGLGLSVVYGIVKQCDGFIDVKSEPGRGTTFTIYLPVTSATEPSAPPPSTPPPAPPGSETVLVVEDEEAVRALVRKMLESQGYHVLEAEHGEQALRIVSESPDRVNLLLTDSVMPQMSGPDLAAKISALNPAIKTILMSGYSEHVIFEQGAPVKELPFIEKPFTAQSLIKRIREVLASPQT